MNNEVAQPVHYPARSSGANNEDANISSHHQVNEDAVWKPRNKSYEPGVVGLHKEIIDFVQYIAPNAEEHWVREVVVSKVRNIILSMWPECQILVFGSFATALYLPTSDIDVVVFGKWSELPLNTVELLLRNSQIASEIKVLSKATVPIVKMTDADSGLHVDISFNMYSSLRAADFINRCVVDYPCLRYLVFILKQFLFQRDLNEVWTGGISSYGLVLMCISFLQQQVKEGDTPETVNLGTLLVEFFELYGRNFNYVTTAIRVSGNGSYVRKDMWQRSVDPGSSPSILCIEDPLSPGNNVGKRSYAALQVRQAFEYAYVVLSSALRSDAEFEGSILSKIIQVSNTTIECRDRLQKAFLNICRILPKFIVPASYQPRKPNSTQKTHQLSDSSSSNAQLKTGANVPESESPSAQQPPKNASPLSQKPTVVSARGLSTHPTQFLRMPLNGKAMSITAQPPQLVYSNQPVFYEPILIPHSMPNVPGAAVAGAKPLFLIFSQFPVVAQPVYQTAVASSLESGSDPMSSAAADSGSDGEERLSDSDARSQHSSNSMNKQSSHNTQQTPDRSFKNTRSASAANPCSSLANQLAPLRLVCSERNVSTSRTPQSGSDAKDNSNLSIKSAEQDHMQADSPSVSPVTNVSLERQPSVRVKGYRRRMRPGRRGPDNMETPSTTQVSTDKARPGTQVTATKHNSTFSSNEESEEGTGGSHGVLKRHCSQPYYCGNKPNAWFPVNPAIRTDSRSPAQNDDGVVPKYYSLSKPSPSATRHQIDNSGNGHNKKQRPGSNDNSKSDSFLQRSGLSNKQR